MFKVLLKQEKMGVLPFQQASFSNVLKNSMFQSSAQIVTYLPEENERDVSLELFLELHQHEVSSTNRRQYY